VKPSIQKTNKKIETSIFAEIEIMNTPSATAVKAQILEMTGEHVDQLHAMWSHLFEPKTCGEFLHRLKDHAHSFCQEHGESAEEAASQRRQKQSSAGGSGQAKSNNLTGVRQFGASAGSEWPDERCRQEHRECAEEAPSQRQQEYGGGSAQSKSNNLGGVHQFGARPGSEWPEAAEVATEEGASAGVLGAPREDRGQAQHWQQEPPEESSDPPAPCATSFRRGERG